MYKDGVRCTASLLLCSLLLKEFVNLSSGNIFSDVVSPSEVCDLYTALKGDYEDEPPTGFDFRDLDLNNYSPVSMVRNGANLLRENKIWQYSVFYDLVLEKDGSSRHGLTNRFLYTLMHI